LKFVELSAKVGGRTTFSSTANGVRGDPSSYGPTRRKATPRSMPRQFEIVPPRQAFLAFNSRDRKRPSRWNTDARMMCFDLNLVSKCDLT
jgi:hypothetical protein